MDTFLYLIPTVFTAANMFCGSYSIILSIRGEFVKSCWMIILGIIFDGIDGMLARKKQFVNRIGVELDSLADFLTFCIAPSVLLWQLLMYRYGLRGMVLCFIYIFFSAVRLAKFNIKMINGQYNKVMFTFDGLPTPAAAGVIVSIVLLIVAFSGEGVDGSRRHVALFLSLVPWLLNLLPAIVLVLSLLMVSKLKYPKINNIKIT
ncbi:MAG: CDP-diacylglycerol--serine O-phosphatidyltransferase, partial [Endomicrobia bacterium]|nr:CDP-diacylglycerol--serine O-phosphatidyltransferase [Endomicrobiia bacterium]